MLPIQTLEQKLTALVAANVARQQNRIARQVNSETLKTLYLDTLHWQSLAGAYGVRMPNTLSKPTTALIRKYLKQLDVTESQFNDIHTSALYFCRNNPTFSAFATVGIILEIRESLDIWQK